MPNNAWPGVQSKAIELIRLPRVAQNAKHCIAWDAIEGNRTHPFDSGSAGCQAVHGLGVERVSSIAFDCTQGHEVLCIDCLRLHSRSWHPALPKSNG